MQNGRRPRLRACPALRAVTARPKSMDNVLNRHHSQRCVAICGRKEGSEVMTTKPLVAAVFAAVALLAAPVTADAHGKKPKRDNRAVVEDCKPYDGPLGYHGNPWCENGWKYAEDYPPGAGPYFDVFDLPQVRRLTRRWDR
jgi:hypothetical protein